VAIGAGRSASATPPTFQVEAMVIKAPAPTEPHERLVAEALAGREAELRRSDGQRE
jgi:hypothetical protein